MSGALMYVMMGGIGVLVIYAVFSTVQDLKTSGSSRLKSRLETGGGTSGSSVRDKAREAREALLQKRLTGDTGVLDTILARFGLVTQVQRMIDQSDLSFMASHLLTGQVIVAAIVALVCVALRLSMVLSIGLPAVILVLPIIALAMRRRSRRSKLMYQLPNVFELMSQALRAGHGLAAAIQVVADQMPDPAGTEFARVYHEQNLGVRVEDALRNMGDRVDILDFRFFVTAVLIQRTTGGDLAEVLDKITSVIRGRIELFGQVAALTAEGRMSGYVLLSLPFVVLMASWWINPEYAGELLYTDTGNMMLYVAGGMQVLGYAMIKKIVNVKV
jgi:tight adherence protein B